MVWAGFLRKNAFRVAFSTKTAPKKAHGWMLWSMLHFMTHSMRASGHNMLVINDLSMSFGGRVLFDGVNLNLNPKSRYGTVGANGTGKTTFLKIISGIEQPSGGTIEVARRGQIGFLKQDHFKYEDTIIVEVVLQGNEALWSAMQENYENEGMAADTVASSSKKKLNQF